MSVERSDAIVLFGASGDLAKKMTFVSLYHLAERGLLDMPIIGVAFSDWSDDDLRKHAQAAIEAAGVKLDKGRIIGSPDRLNLFTVEGDLLRVDLDLEAHVPNTLQPGGWVVLEKVRRRPRSLARCLSG